jgi:hypothetical protein
MKENLMTRLAVALVLLLLPAVGRAQTLQQADGFVRHLYAGYEHPSSPAEPDYTGREAASVFSPAMVRLIRRDQHQAHGEVGKLDGDPICDCQDSGGMKLTHLDVTATAAGRAAARVTLHFPGAAENHLQIQLLWGAAGWRIDDIATSWTPSLHHFLESPAR